jgi:AsmA protein
VQKFLKYSAIIFIVLIILLLVIPLFIPLESYKGVAVKKVKETIGRELEINGAMSLSLLPSPEIKIKDIKVSSIAGAQLPYLCEVKEMAASVSLFSLLSGNIVISEIKINKPTINMERLPNRSASWEFSELELKKSKDLNEEKSDKKEQLAFYIKSLKILDAKINYIDSASSMIIEIDNLEIKNFHGPANLAAEFYSTGKNYDIKGSIKENKGIIALETNLDILKEKVKIAGDFDRNNMSFIGKLLLEGDGKNLKTITHNLDIEGDLKHKLIFDINADKELIKISDINFTIGDLLAKGNANYYIEKNKANLNLKLNPGDIDLTLTPLNVPDKGLNEKIYLKAISLKPVIDALKINAKNLPNNVLDKAFSFSADLSYIDQNLFLKDISLNIDKANLKGNCSAKNWDKDLVVSYDLKINNPAAFANLSGFSLPVNIIDIMIKGETTKAKDRFQTSNVIVVANTTNIIKGDIGLGDSIKPSLALTSSGDNLSQTLRQLLKSTTGNLIGNYSLSTRIEGDIAKIIEINIDKSTFSLKDGPLNINGAISLNLANVKPKIAANLKMSSLNLDNQANALPISNGAIKKEPDAISTPWSNDKIDLSFLNKADGDFIIAIQKITKGDFVFDNIKTTMNLADGVLSLKSLNGGLYGGRLEASGQISAQSAQQANFKATLKEAALKNIIPQDGKIKVTQGTINFDTDLKTKGQTQYQYVSNLLGNAKLIATDGKVSGFDLQKVLDSLKKIKNLDGILRMLDASFSGGETAFKQLHIATDIKEGIANITYFKLDAPSATALATGNINIPKYILDVNSAINVNIKSMPTLKVHVYGSLSNPQHKLDTKALQEYLIKNVLTNVIDDIKKNKKPEDILKGIIGKSDEDSSLEGAENNQKVDPVPQQNPVKDIETQVKKGLKGLFK